MADVFATQWVLSSWPFRLGSILYDPILQMDIQSWDLQDLTDAPGLVQVPAEMLDPRRDYKTRSKELARESIKDQELLRAMYELDIEGNTELRPTVSSLVPKELNTWLKTYGLEWNDLALNSLDSLMSTLESWSMEEHHLFCADWWETWEMPHRNDHPSTFRQEAGPGGSLYASVYGEDALAVWQHEQSSLGLSDFSIWAVLRSHWGWRLEFSDQPRPQFLVLDQLDAFFG